MKKKLIVLMLALSFIFSGCGNSEEVTEEPIEQAEAETPTPSPVPTPSPEPTATPTPVIQEPVIEQYSDEYVSFEYDKDLFTVNPSEDNLTLSIECPAMPGEPEGAHNTVMGIVTQPNQYISEISESDVRETLETISETVCLGLFELNEDESVVSDGSKYSDNCAEYSMELSDGSQCYARTLNYNTYITTVVLRICEYSKDYNDSFMDIYNSAESKLGNYDFSVKATTAPPESESASASKATPAKSTSSGSSSSEADTSGETGISSAPASNTSNNGSVSAGATSDGQSPSGEKSTVANTNEAANPPAANNPGAGGDGSNFNTYDNASQQQTEATYVLNTSTKKIHYPSCRSVKKIAPQNYSTSNSSIDDLKAQGYSTCGNCFK